MELGFDYTDDLILQTSILNAAGGGTDSNAESGTGGGSSSWSTLSNDTSACNATATSSVPTVSIVQVRHSEDTLNAELFQGYPASLLTIATGFCLLFMMVGIPGNLITIIALFRCKKVRIFIYLLLLLLLLFL
ncbi:hypothetical protein O3M35_013180 [Rhynocoris fuscipes]|uniref:G-protein coupled receptors family 1 profile domain-containing protein n=1 Tax=Rhynocoris fuscipes TaxID=488301 RepID=A0AAW1CJC5_9HEMI